MDRPAKSADVRKTPDPATIGMPVTLMAGVRVPPLGEAASWRRLHTILRQLDLGFEEATAEDGPWLGVVLRMLTANPPGKG